MPMSVTDAVLARRSVRAYLEKPVSEQLIRDILDIARRTPSGGNLQPWNVYVVTGDALSDLKACVRDKRATGEREGTEYVIFPNPLKEHFNARRRKSGEDLYTTIKIRRDDKAGRAAQFDANFTFFDAPVGLIFAIDRAFDRAQWLHMGMFLQTLMLVAEEAGLATCAQEAWAGMHKTLAEFVELPGDLMICCGMSLGYADLSAPINELFTDRLEVDDFTTFKRARGQENISG